MLFQMNTDKWIKKCGKRFAFEWFVCAEDERYFKLSKHYTDEKCKKITTLAATNAVITGLLVVLFVVSLYRFKD